MVDNRYNPYKGLSDRCVESLMPKGVEHNLAKAKARAKKTVLNL